MRVLKRSPVKVKIAVNFDNARHWPLPVDEALGRVGLATRKPYGDGLFYWDVRDVPRHHPVLIAALEEWERTRERSPYEGPYCAGHCEYIVEVELPSGRYSIAGAYKETDDILIPEMTPWVQV